MNTAVSSAVPTAGRSASFDSRDTRGSSPFSRHQVPGAFDEMSEAWGSTVLCRFIKPPDGVRAFRPMRTHLCTARAGLVRSRPHSRAAPRHMPPRSWLTVRQKVVR